MDTLQWESALSQIFTTLANEGNPSFTHDRAMQTQTKTVPARRAVMLLHEVASTADASQHSRFRRDNDHFSGFASPEMRNVIEAELPKRPSSVNEPIVTGISKVIFVRCILRACSGFVPLETVQAAAAAFIRKRLEHLKIRKLAANNIDKCFPPPRTIVVRQVVSSDASLCQTFQTQNSGIKSLQRQGDGGASGGNETRVALCVHCSVDRLDESRGGLVKSVDQASYEDVDDSEVKRTARAAGSRMEELVLSWADSGGHGAGQESHNAFVSIALWTDSDIEAVAAARASAEAFIQRCRMRRRGLCLVIALCTFDDEEDGVADDEPYPINALRNRAMDVARLCWCDNKTSADLWLMCIDADFVCSRGLAFCLLRSIRETENLSHDTSSSGMSLTVEQTKYAGDLVAFVVAAFELIIASNHGDTMPIDTYALHSVYAASKERCAVPFQSVQCPEAHRSTCYAKWWLEHQKSNSLRNYSSYSVNFAPKYEPYVCVRALSPQLPQFDERFTGYGYNKMAFIATLHNAGYSFRVVLGDCCMLAECSDVGISRKRTIGHGCGSGEINCKHNAFFVSRRHPPSRACQKSLSSPRSRSLKRALYESLLRQDKL